MEASVVVGEGVLEEDGMEVPRDLVVVVDEGNEVAHVLHDREEVAEVVEVAEAAAERWAWVLIPRSSSSSNNSSNSR